MVVGRETTGHRDGSRDESKAISLFLLTPPSPDAHIGVDIKSYLVHSVSFVPEPAFDWITSGGLRLRHTQQDELIALPQSPGSPFLLPPVKKKAASSLSLLKV